MLLRETAPPRALTAGRMFITKFRILEYAHAHNALPPDLTGLPAMPANYDASTRDEWGRPFDYSFDTSGTVTLRSLGADSAPGGEGDNADMTGVFAAHDANGGWANPNSPWARDPLKP
jgi:hypothetical protein